jgi:hypothetical protein
LVKGGIETDFTGGLDVALQAEGVNSTARQAIVKSVEAALKEKRNP